jgi:hypothetical protein
MAITLGKSGTTPPVGSNIISASYTEETETIDISNRSNITGGYKASKAGFTTKTWEIECHDAGTLVTDLTGTGTDGSFNVMSVTENIAIDGAVTFSVTAKQF